MNKKLLKTITYSTIIAICLIAVSLLAFFSHSGAFAIDRFMINKMQAIQSKGLTGIFAFITSFGSVYSFILLTALILIMVKDKKIGVVLGLDFVVAALATVYIKFTVRRPRPIGVALIEETGFSFLSAHAMISMAFYGLAIFLILKYVKNKPLKILFSSSLGLFIIAIGISRVYLGVHYFTDIIAGFCMGLVVCLIFTLTYDYIYLKKPYIRKKNDKN
ncbi:MAG: phosphatase PAP2 family protein [Clostridia bacterium]|nr:phosphatase PAP2 family protein [Clostridia bacterium]